MASNKAHVGPTVRKVADALSAARLTTGAYVPEPLAHKRICGLCPDQEASDGSASWLSAKVLEHSPQRLNHFKGTLLVAPRGAQTEGLEFAVLTCDSPKRAFTMLVHSFFADLTSVRWPAFGEQVSDESIVDPTARLAPGALIGSGCQVGERVEIGPNSVLANTTVGSDVVIGANCSIGLPGFGYERDGLGRLRRFPHVGRVLIGENVEIGSNTCIDRGALGATVIGAHAKIDNLVHVAHNVVIGEDSVIIAHAMVGGSTIMGDGVWCAPAAAIMNKLTIGSGATLGMGAVVIRDVAEGATIVGNPGRCLARSTK